MATQNMGIDTAWGILKKNWSGVSRVEDVGEFDSIEAALGQNLPANYKWFLMASNGGETLPPLPRLTFYPLEELIPRREDGQPPGVLEIATNDSDGYAFDLTINRSFAHYPIVVYSLGERDRSDLEICAKHFEEFLGFIVQDRLFR